MIDYVGKLYKISDCDDPYYANNIESGKEVEGNFLVLPKVEYAFNMSPNKGWLNYRTSLVEEIIMESDDFVIFKTMNSVYKLTFKEIKQDG